MPIYIFLLVGNPDEWKATNNYNIDETDNKY